MVAIYMSTATFFTTDLTPFSLREFLVILLELRNLPLPGILQFVPQIICNGF